MLKCPFCAFENEDGALFCEQCKSDLSGVESTPKAGAAPSEPVPVAAVLDETVPMAAPVMEAMPAAPIEATAPMAEVVAEAVPEAAPAEAEAAPAAPEAPPAAEAAPAPAAPPAAQPLAPDAQPKLVVIRGQKIGVEYPIYPDLNFVGRADEKPVDIDLEDQEPPDRVLVSRQHALITLEGGVLTIEDLNSANYTYVNRTRVYPGQKRPLNVNDVIQFGSVQMKVKA